ncbi:hypothetical protein LINPERHAP2_LOCUS37597 [Linum perenne]
MLLFILQLTNRSIFIPHLRSHLLRSTTTSAAADSSLVIFLSTRGITSAVKSERLRSPTNIILAGSDEG